MDASSSLQYPRLTKTAFVIMRPMPVYRNPSSDAFGHTRFPDCHLKAMAVQAELVSGRDVVESLRTTSLMPSRVEVNTNTHTQSPMSEAFRFWVYSNLIKAIPSQERGGSLRTTKPVSTSSGPSVWIQEIRTSSSASRRFQNFATPPSSRWTHSILLSPDRRLRGL